MKIGIACVVVHVVDDGISAVSLLARREIACGRHLNGFWPGVTAPFSRSR